VPTLIAENALAALQHSREEASTNHSPMHALNPKCSTDTKQRDLRPNDKRGSNRKSVTASAGVKVQLCLFGLLSRLWSVVCSL
jgi:hypothetical protein